MTLLPCNKVRSDYDHDEMKPYNTTGHETTIQMASYITNLSKSLINK